MDGNISTTDQLRLQFLEAEAGAEVLAILTAEQDIPYPVRNEHAIDYAETNPDLVPPNTHIWDTLIRRSGRKIRGYLYFVRSDETQLVDIGFCTVLSHKMLNILHTGPAQLSICRVIQSSHAAAAAAAAQAHFHKKKFAGTWFRLSRQDVMNYH